MFFRNTQILSKGYKHSNSVFQCFKVFPKNASTNTVNIAPKRPWKKTKVTLISIGLYSSLFYAYYKTQHILEQRRIRVFIESLGRLIRSCTVGLMIVTDYKYNLQGLDKDDDIYKKAIKECHLRTAEILVKTCIANGGMYVKLGQGLSMMNHILPKEFYLTLRRLQNEALRAEGNDIDDLFLEEFNKLPNEMFKEFEYKPLAAASLAQVHKAVTFEGDEVAVKLQYIDLRERFRFDFATSKLMLKMVSLFYPDFDFVWVLDEMKETLIKELDFINEAENSKRCFSELKHLKFLYVPKVYDNKTTKRILTMEFIKGLTLGETEKINKAGFNLKEIDIKLAKIFGEQIFSSGFVHADPHHGNIFVRTKAGTKNEAEIVLIDHGLYCYVNEKDRKCLCQIWKYIILKDEEKIKQYASELNVSENNALIFASSLTQRELFKPVHPKLIFAKDWLIMSEDEKVKAELEGYIRVPSQTEFRKMKSSEFKEWRVKAKPVLDQLHEDILKTFQEYPKNLLLVCRNLNTVRSILHDHGNLVDRHTIMARIAVTGAYNEKMTANWNTQLFAWLDLKRFDIILAYDRFLRWSSRSLLKFLVVIGKIQPELIEELKNAEKKIM